MLEPRYAGLASYLNLNMLWSNPRNKNVEKWSGQLKFEITHLEPYLHKITGQFNRPEINWPIF